MTTFDRSFEDIADHFEQKVYGGLKGQIRLAVLTHDLTPLTNGQKLHVLDVGAGLGQISLELSRLGHDCTLTDPSSAMLAKAKTASSAMNITGNLRFIMSSYQKLHEHLSDEKFDLILCHAVLEWVADKEALFAVLDGFLVDGGVLSLCFYNPVAPIYKNLLMGNFHHLKSPKPSDLGSLTPNHPASYDTVKTWLKNYTILHESGIRVFSDYATHKRGGLADTEAVIEMELFYSNKLPFRLMGRYLHIMAQKPTNTDSKPH